MSTGTPTGLTRRYDEPVEVVRGDDAPAGFVRRRRRYAVHAVLAHWWETSAWWAADDLAAGVADDEHELWRVEAAPPGGPVAVVDLSFSWATGRWTVASVLD